MTGSDSRYRLKQMIVGGVLAVTALASTGCQVDVAGQTLPSPYYLSDDVQYFPAGPEFKLLAHNVLGDDEARTNASLVVHEGQLLLRNDANIYAIGR